MPTYILRGGCHYRKEGGKLKKYVSGDTLELDEYEANLFPEKFILASPPEVVTENIKGDDKANGKFRIVHKGAGKYNVENTTSGKPVNPELLTKEEAEQLMADIT